MFDSQDTSAAALSAPHSQTIICLTVIIHRNGRPKPPVPTHVSLLSSTLCPS